MPRARQLRVFSVLSALALVGMLLFSAKAYCQLAGATLTGSVTDPSGAAIPGAQIQIQNIATGSVRAAKTDSSGFYSAPNLAPGDYEVTVSANGFKTTIRTNITLTVGARQTLNVPLEVGQITQKVTVSSAPPAVQLTTPTMSGYVSQATVRQLPLNGRDWTSLATLQPGVVAGRAQASTSSTANRGNRGFGNQLSDAGHRPNENTYQLDGIVINDYSNGAPGSVEGVNLGVDAIREFSVMTANYSASAGRTSGAVINAVTKSGTNQFHGDAYIFYRDKIFNATPYTFGGAGGKPTFRRNQFGFSGGGPIQKNKTFIFGDYEAIRQSIGQILSTKVPSEAARAGNLCSSPSSGSTCTPTTVPVNSAIAPALALWPSPSNHVPKGTFSPTPGGNGDTLNFVSSGQQTVNENYFTVRADHTFSNSDNIEGTYFFDRAPQTNPDPLGNFNSSVFTKRQMIGITENHIFSATFLNTFRIGFSRVVGLVNKPGTAFNPAAADPSLGSVPGKFAALLNVGGITTAGGLGSGSEFFHHWNSYQLYDDAFWTHGTHSISFGFALERMEYNCFSAPRANGSWNFGSLSDFLQNIAQSVQLTLPQLSAEVGVRQTRYATYIQDEWRVRPNFTLDMGFRYEPLSRPTEAHNGFKLLDNFFTGTIDTTINPQTLYAGNPTLKDFDPRVGFAWDPLGTGKTSVRAAFGIFDVLPLPYIYTIGTSLTYPFAITSSATSTGTPALTPGAFPKGALSIIEGQADPQLTYAARYVQQYPNRSYAMNWNLNIQRQFFSNWTAMVGYVGMHTLHEEVTYDDSNMVIPSVIDGGLFWPCSASVPDTATGSPCTAGLGTRANPNIGFDRAINWDGWAKYNGFQAELRSKPTHGFQFQASYTYGKCTDIGSGAQLGDPFLNSITSLIYFSHAARYGRCDFDITQNFIANWLWTVPNPKFSSALANHIVGGWELGGILTTSTGVPWTAILSGDPLGQNSTDPVDFASKIPGCNTYVGPSFHNGYQVGNVSCFTVPMAPSGASGICDQFLGTGSGIAGSCRNVFGNSGRNELKGPDLVNMDFSVIKDNYIPAISEAFNIQLRFEFFNLFNHPNFQSPQAFDTNFAFNGAGLPVGGFGTSDATTTDMREFQVAAKIIW